MNLSPLYDGGRDHPFSQTIIHVLTKANMKMIIWQSWQGLMNPNLSYIQMISTFTFRAKNSSPLQIRMAFSFWKKKNLQPLEIVFSKKPKKKQPLETVSIRIRCTTLSVVFCTLCRPLRTFITSSVLWIRCAEFANSWAGHAWYRCWFPIRLWVHRRGNRKNI